MNHKRITKVGALILCFSVLLFSGCTGTEDAEKPSSVEGPKDKDGEEPVPTTTESEPETEEREWLPPLEDAEERVTLKPFGIFITPQNSPVEDERFSGYHTGVDFETLEGEEDEEVPVRAVCSGRFLQKRTASGYGGLAVQGCELGGEPVIVVYGHLDIQSIEPETGDRLEAGAGIGVLGEGGSAETDGERKHLHLGMYQGEEINIKGYTDSKEDLAEWLDPCDHVCQ